MRYVFAPSTRWNSGVPAITVGWRLTCRSLPLMTATFTGGAWQVNGAYSGAATSAGRVNRPASSGRKSTTLMTASVLSGP